MLGCLTQTVIVPTAEAQPAARPSPPTRLTTAPGTPALTPAGPNAEALAKLALKKKPSDSDAAANPTLAAPGANPPLTVEGNFLIGPVYSNAPELTVIPGVPEGKVEQFSMDSTNS